MRAKQTKRVVWLAAGLGLTILAFSGWTVGSGHGAPPGDPAGPPARVESQPGKAKAPDAGRDREKASAPTGGGYSPPPEKTLGVRENAEHFPAKGATSPPQGAAAQAQPDVSGDVRPDGPDNAQQKARSGFRSAGQTDPSAGGPVETPGVWPPSPSIPPSPVTPSASFPGPERPEKLPVQGSDDGWILGVIWVGLGVLAVVVLVLWRFLRMMQEKNDTMLRVLASNVEKNQYVERKVLDAVMDTKKLRQEVENRYEEMGESMAKSPNDLARAVIQNGLIEVLHGPDQELRAVLASVMRGALADVLTREQGNALLAAPPIQDLYQRLARLEQQADSTPFPATPPPGDAAAPPAGVLDQDRLAAAVLRLSAETERQVLQKTWLALVQGDPGFNKRFFMAMNPRTDPHQAGMETVLALADGLKDRERLGALAAKTVEPVRRLMENIQKIKEYTDIKNASLDEVSRERLEDLREANIYLGLLRCSEAARDPLRLDFQDWLTDNFPRFADAFYREYQLAVRQGAAVGLDVSRKQVERLLESVGLRVVEITLGRTVFDNRLHMARSTAKDPSMPDGTIAGVIRNGFERVEGGLTQQAEVIVNRI